MEKRARRTRMKTDVLLIKADKWEATYVSGKLVEQGAPIRSDRKIAYFLRLAEKHNFDIRNLREVTATKQDIELVNTQYVFPDKLSQLHGDYKNLPH